MMYGRLLTELYSQTSWARRYGTTQFRAFLPSSHMLETLETVLGPISTQPGNSSVHSLSRRWCQRQSAICPQHTQQMFLMQLYLLRSTVSVFREFDSVFYHLCWCWTFVLFTGKSIQLFGNVTGGMEYLVDVDGSLSTGTPSGQVLASVSGLNTGYHNVALVAKPSVPGNAATLLFESAVVTVGTALTR